MSKDMPEGFTCECGTYHLFGLYVAAHWNLRLTHTCEKCKRQHSVRRGVATLIAKRDEVHNTGS